MYQLLSKDLVISVIIKTYNISEVLKGRLLGIRFRMPLSLAVKSLKSSPENQTSKGKYILHLCMTA